MAIKKIITTDLFNKYVNEQIKPYVDDSSAIVKEQLDQEVNDRIDGDNLKIDLLGNEAWSHQPYHFPYHLALTPTATDLVAKAFTITLDNTRTLTQYDFTLPAATTTTAGIMTAADKVKLDSCAPGNYVTLDTTQEITGQKTFTIMIKASEIGDKDDANLHKTIADICDAVDVVGNFQTRKDYSPDAVSHKIELPAEPVNFTLQSLTAKGIADSAESVVIEAYDTYWTCSSRGNPILQADNDIILYKTGSLQHMNDESGRYGYDSINFETGKIDRYTIKLSLWDILHEKKEGEATGTLLSDWTWNNSGAAGSKGYVTIAHSKMTEYFGTYSPGEGQSIVNFAFNVHLVGVFAESTELQEDTIVVKANSGTFAISGFKNRIPGYGQGKAGVFAYISHPDIIDDAKASYVIMKRQTKLEEDIPTTATINDTFRGSADAHTYIEGLNAGTAKVGFLSVADKFYTKAQIDEEFATKASFNDKKLIVKAVETQATKQLYGDLFGYGDLVYANFTTESTETPFYGPTLFINVKSHASVSNHWLVISNGAVYEWFKSGSAETATHRFVQPYMPKSATHILTVAEWSASKTQTLDVSTTYGISLGANDVLSITPASGYEQAYIDAGITRTVSGNIITFTAETVPTQAININIVYQQGEQLGTVTNEIVDIIEQINPDDLDA